MAEAAPACTTGDGCLRSDHRSLAASIVSKSSRASTSAVKLAMVSAAADSNPGWFPDNNQTKRGTARSVRSRAKFSWSVPMTDILLTMGNRTCQSYEKWFLIKTCLNVFIVCTSSVGWFRWRMKMRTMPSCLNRSRASGERDNFQTAVETAFNSGMLTCGFSTGFSSCGAVVGRPWTWSSNGCSSSYLARAIAAV